MTFYESYDPAGQRRTLTAVIRVAAPADLDELSAFGLSAVTRTRDDWATMIEKSQADDDRTLLVAEVDGALAAFGQAHFLPGHLVDHAPAGFYLTGVTVLPPYRRAGLGRELTAARMRWIAGRADAAWYFAAAANPVSIELHNCFGFQEVARASRIHGVSFESDEGVLFRAPLSGT